MSILDEVRRVFVPSDSDEQEQGNAGQVNFSLVQLTILISISTIAMLKGYFTLIGVLDIMVGLYGLLTISMVFASFFLAYTKYEDPAKKTTIRRVANNKKENLEFVEGSRSASPLMVLSASSFLPSNQPRVSILIPVFNEQDLIKETVNSCMRSMYPSEKMEIILVNDGSTDGTYAILELMKQEYHQFQLKIVHLAENMGKRKAIREAIVQGKAEGEILVLVDSDCIIDEYAVESLVKSLDDPEVGAVSGHGLVKNADQNVLTKIQQTWYDGQFSIMKGMESSLESVNCCSGILSAYKREAVLPCLESWSNDKFLGAEFKSGDDRHLTSFLLGGSHYYLGTDHRAWKVKYCESALTYTEVPSTLKKLIRQQTRWKQSWVRLFCFNFPFYFRYRPLSASYIYYMQTILSFISPIVAIRSLVLLPMQGDFFNGLIYLSGVFFIGSLYAVEFKLRNLDSGTRWLYRLLMPFLSVGLLNFLIYFSLIKIRSKSWMTR